MYEKVFLAMDAVVFIVWGWCLYRFCGSFLIRRQWGGKRDKDVAEPVLPEDRGRFLKNGWLMWCFWSVWKWLFGLLAETDFDSLHSLLRTFLVYGVLFLFLRLFYEGGRGAMLFSFVTFATVSEISRFLGHAASLPGNWVYDIGNRMLEEGRIADLTVYLRFVEIYSFLLQALMDVIFLLFLWGTLHCAGRAFRGRSRAFDRAELKLLLLPGCISGMFCVLLRVILVTVEEGIPRTLYDRYPLLMGVVPVLLLLCLCSVIYSIRFFCELKGLQEEKNRSAVLEQQLESMEEHLRETERVYAGVRAMKHDMKNQLAVAAELAGRADAQAGLRAYLDQVTDQLDELDFPCQTGSAVVDTLVGIKFHEMQERIPGISFQAEDLLIPSNLEVSHMDLSLILGNGLDNAIEACERLKEAEGRAGAEQGAAAGTVNVVEAGPGAAAGTVNAAGAEAGTEPGAPWIRVGAGMRASCFLLKISNSYSGRLKYSAGQEFPETLKEEKGLHGIGLQSIQRVAMKYHGGVDWRAEGGIFTLTVMLKSG